MKCSSSCCCILSSITYNDTIYVLIAIEPWFAWHVVYWTKVTRNATTSPKWKLEKSTVGSQVDSSYRELLCEVRDCLLLHGFSSSLLIIMSINFYYCYHLDCDCIVYCVVVVVEILLNCQFELTSTDVVSCRVSPCNLVSCKVRIFYIIQKKKKKKKRKEEEEAH